jgi:hypothetical protein
MHDLDCHRKERNLVSVERSALDDRSLQGYVLACSSQLVVLQYVYDFNLDGLMVLRTGDITEVKCTDTDIFQKKLLSKEGLEDRVPFDATFAVQDWQSLLLQLAREHGLLILECEGGAEKSFFIGRLVLATATEAQVHHFTGTGRWEEEPTSIPVESITCCQVANNYLNFYARHFARNAP